ncbi:MAG: diguanylate cyclase [Desulfotignum sp.]|nr:diguanylate cyclase [Desulfotignum sp.]
MKELLSETDIMDDSEKIIEDFELLDLFDITELKHINESFADACGVASTLVDKTGEPITPPANHSPVCTIIRSTSLGKERCRRSAVMLGNKSIELGRPYSCSCYGIGFVDASAPIVVKGNHLGNWLIGQGNLSDVNERRVEEYAREIGADETMMLKAFRDMPNMPRKEFDKKVEFLWYVTQQLCEHAYLNFKLSRSLFLIQKSQNELRQHKSDLEHIVEDRTNHLKSAMEKIRHFSITDNLTGCYNRLYLSENLDREVSRSLRYKRSISLAMFDIDRFKSVNDTYGHQCGDRILVELVNRVTSGTREKVDWLVRYGGDEFLLVMPEAGEKQAFQTCQRTRKLVEEMQIEWEGRVIPITVSIGFTCFNPVEAAMSVDVEQLVKAADEALYKAKQTGRNKVAANFIRID